MLLEEKLERILLILSFAWNVLDVAQGAGDYHKYYVEEDCPTGVLTVSLNESGRDTAVQLAATRRASYSLAMECRISLRAPDDDYRIVIAIRRIGFRVNWDATCKDYIKITDTTCAALYRPEEEMHDYSDSNHKDLLYHVSKEGIDNHTLTGHPGFELVITAQKRGVDCKNNKEWFQCENRYCIWSDLKCDKHNNCGDLSDERQCGEPVSDNATVLIILGVLILLLLFIMCVATLLCSKNETVRRFSNRLRSRTLSYMPRFSKGT